MQRFGGCAIIPSGAYHMELPTTITQRQVDAPKVLWPEPGMRAATCTSPGLERQ
jgi:hypothetical protein